MAWEEGEWCEDNYQGALIVGLYISMLSQKRY